jgi:hypothetical protein
MMAGTERSSAIQRALALVIPTHKRHFARGRLQLLISRTYCHAVAGREGKPQHQLHSRQLIGYKQQQNSEPRAG